MVSASREKRSSKVTISIIEKNPNEVFIQKYFSTRQKMNLSTVGVSEKTYKKSFALARKFVSTTQNEAFVIRFHYT